ncbi:arrestin (macronuclear) [Tetrahymena thermophila SB210]|uniref:Arrestin n=1 Tax=Tetrahymena thermophila (strain SB210) TaxID=312017 RepID=Q23YG0_TETTS|nr:arrestin [Tetrahymena thermophila SB210]EAS01573.1 arrestin [Tetrahymena thermophila SB210]|eukprot:XP_001021818.1 arrestin [Tetrahymena thermophila SB210]
MGQSHPNDNRRQVRGGIYIQLQQTAFVSNQVIQGLLNINLEEPFQGHILQITLNGVEETRFTYAVRSGKHTSTRHAIGQNNFLNFSIPIYDFSQGSNDPAFIIQPCQLVIPFQLVVADKLPSSMRYFYTEANQCSIKYNLIASIIPTEANVKPVQGIQEIFIGQQIPTIDLPNTTTSTQSPEVCCCCKSGQIKYNITTNSRSYSPNEIISMKIDIDFNQFNKNIKCLNIKLIGLLSMKASNTQREKHVVIYEQPMSVKVEKSQIKQEVQIQIPGDVTLSSQGQMIQVQYGLQLTSVIDTCCCVSDSQPHEIKLYINPQSNQIFGYNGIPQQLQVQAPQSWNPIQLQPTQFNQQQSAYIQQQQNQFFAREQQYQIQLNNQQNNLQIQSQQPINYVPEQMGPQVYPSNMQMATLNQNFL